MSGAMAEGTCGTCPWEIDSNGVLTVYPGILDNTYNKSPWIDYNDLVEQIVFKAGDDGSKVILNRDGRGLFRNLTNVTIIDMRALDLSRTIGASYMFAGCSNLVEIQADTEATPANLEWFETRNHRATYVGIEHLCDSCSALEVAVLPPLNLSNSDTIATDAFKGCSSLIELDVSGISNKFAASYSDDSKLDFSDCTNLIRIKVGDSTTAGAVPDYKTDSVYANKWVQAEGSSRSFRLDQIVNGEVGSGQFVRPRQPVFSSFRVGTGGEATIDPTSKTIRAVASETDNLSEIETQYEIDAAGYEVKCTMPKTYTPGKAVTVKVSTFFGSWDWTIIVRQDAVYHLSVVEDDGSSFGTVPFGETSGKTLTYTVTNIGNREINTTPQEMTGDSDLFSVKWSRTGLKYGGTMAQGESQTLTISCSESIDAGEYGATLTISKGTKAETSIPISLVVEKATQGQVDGLYAIPQSSAGSDGAICGLVSTSSYQYRSGDGGEWVGPISGVNSVEGLKAGSYQVRFAESSNYQAGEPCQVTVENLSDIDKTQLEKLIADARALETGVVVSVNGNDVTWDTKWVTPEIAQELLKAISKAEVALADSTATENDISNVARTLSGAMGSYVSSLASGNAKRSLKNATISIPKEVEYSGEATKASIVVRYGEENLAEGTDYIVEYKNNDKPGTAILKVVGKGQYEGEQEKSFSIIARNMSDVTISDLDDQYPYTGSKVTPNMKLMWHNEILAENIDYKTSYVDNRDVGTASVTITGLGKYYGTLTKTFIIVYELQDGKDLSLSKPLSDGESLTASLSIEQNSFANMRVVLSGRNGSASVSLIRDGNVIYNWDTSVSLGPSYVSPLALPAGTYQLVVESRNASTVVEKLGFRSWSRDGGIEYIEHEPNSGSSSSDENHLVVGKPLAGSFVETEGSLGILDTDEYTLALEGKSDVALIFNSGNLLSSLVKGDYFLLTVKCPDGTYLHWGGVEDADGSVKKEVSEGLFYCGTLEPGFYQISLSYNTAFLCMSDTSTTAAIKAREKDLMYVLMAVAYPRSVPRLSDCEVEVAAVTYDGVPVTPAIKVTDPTSGTVVYGPGADQSLSQYYEVSYEKNDGAGTGVVRVQCKLSDSECPKGVYSGSVSKEFAIKPCPIRRVELSLIEEQCYDEAEKKPTLMVAHRARFLKEGVDYELSYKDNISLGTATVIVTGKGNYTGTKTTTFEIAIPFSDVTMRTGHAGDIGWLAENKISEGWTMADGTREFRPYANVARADMAAFLFRLAKSWGIVDDSWQPTGKVSFTDVTPGTPHYREVMWLAESGVSEGWRRADGTREFRPYASVARADMAAFLFRLAKVRGVVDDSWQPQAGSASFLDADGGTPHYREVMWLASSGVSEGWPVSGGREFRPYANVARADMAAFLRRLDGLK